MAKQISLPEAVKIVSNWSMVFIGGFGGAQGCLAFSRELVRQKKHDLHLITSGPTDFADLLAGANVINKMETSSAGNGTRGYGANIQRKFSEKTLQIEDYTNLSMTMRLYGGAMGVPFMPVKSILGSDIEKKSSFRKTGEKISVVFCPFTDERVCLVPSINPDFGIIHVKRADTEGNVLADDVAASDADGLKASDVKIVLADEIVSAKQAGKSQKRVAVPGLMVDYIVRVPPEKSEKKSSYVS
jgi:acyl CoA:acetate/3-ketoacid CoA transferase alpha subunit